MFKFKKKLFIFVIVVVCAITLGAAFNHNYVSYAKLDVTFANVEALAGEGESGGTFPACMCGDGSGAASKVYQCKDGECKKVDGNKGTLNVNYCSQCED